MDSDSHRILIVDDAYVNINLLNNFLSKEGYDVSFSTQGEDVFEILQREHIDLILLDIMMPGMDGYEVCKRLTADPQTQDIPIIFLTAKTDKADIVRGFEYGAVDYIFKPFHSAELIARIKTHLDLKKTRHLVQDYADRLAQCNERLLRQNQEVARLKELLSSCDSCMAKIADDGAVIL
jgi:putative two-component system response regulator